MALTKLGFIVIGTDYDPKEHRMVMASPVFEMLVVGVPDASHGPAIAKEMVDQDIQLIEICGGFGPLWTAKIIEAIDNKIPIGAVAYGPEAITPMHELFA